MTRAVLDPEKHKRNRAQLGQCNAMALPKQNAPELAAYAGQIGGRYAKTLDSFKQEEKHRPMMVTPSQPPPHPQPSRRRSLDHESPTLARPCRASPAQTRCGRAWPGQALPSQATWPGQLTPDHACSDQTWSGQAKPGRIWSGLALGMQKRLST